MRKKIVFLMAALLVTALAAAAPRNAKPLSIEPKAGALCSVMICARLCGANGLACCNFGGGACGCC